MRVEKFEIARSQLETAVWIFLHGLDRSSVCTLSGAASGILDNLVKRAGKEPFVDYALRVYQAKTGHTPKRQSYLHYIEKRVGVTANKHLALHEPDNVEIDLETSARNSLERAMADYTAIAGQDEPFVQAFLQHCWNSMDGPAMMEEYSRLPARMRRKP